MRPHGPGDALPCDRERACRRQRGVHRPDRAALEDHGQNLPRVYQLVPATEVERRLGAFQEALREHGLDGAVLVQSVDLYYFTGTTQNAHLVVPAEGEPVLLVRRTLERARAESPLERIEALRSLRDLAAALDGAGVSGGRLGFELDVLPALRYLDYAKRLPAFELADCSGLIRGLRAVKSAWELERIREAARHGRRRGRVRRAACCARG